MKKNNMMGRMNGPDLSSQNKLSDDGLLCVPALIKYRAECAPEAAAIEAPERLSLNYGNLYGQMGEVVASLNKMGIGRNDRVAIVLPNGPEMAVAFLTVAACATSAPLNPAYKLNEYEFYLSDLNAKALIIQSGINTSAKVAAETLNIPIIELLPNLNSEAGAFMLAGNQLSGQTKGGLARPDDVALVLHTSGTTSRPKIVPLLHKNICTSAHNIHSALKLTDSDKCLNVMPLFHIHGLIGAVLSSLSAGASVVCTPGFYAPGFFGWLEEFQPSWYTAVPTMHQAVLERAVSNQKIIEDAPLRFVRSSSSSLPHIVMEKLETVFNVPVIESYGMTEASHQMASNPLPPLQRKPGSVGVASGPEVNIMDGKGNLLQVGKIGEIVIRGENITPGYENNPDANRESFTNGWFRTGDQGQLDNDGYLFITGRIKEIINRGGEKISPREVDETLMEHPAVAQAVTFAIPHEKLGEEVGAAVVLRKNLSTTEREIQEFAANRLADFKTPRKVIIVDEIPKGPTGKLQRIGLAEKLGISMKHIEKSVVDVDYKAPNTPLEEKLVGIWSDVLSIKQIGVDHNFFQLGGDSVLAALIISRVRKLMSVEISFLAFFEKPTIASMAGEIETSRKKGLTSKEPMIESISREGELPLSFAQERTWFLDQYGPDNPAFNRPASLLLTGPLKPDTLKKGLNEICRRHEVLRTNFKTVNGSPVQSISKEPALVLQVTDLTDLPEVERRTRSQSLAIREALRTFNLAEDSLVRASLLKIGEEEHVLILNFHHIVFDGWSMEVLLKELLILYEAFSNNTPSPLSELPIQYADFAHWQRNWLQEEILETQLSYWKKNLAGIPVVQDLPTDLPRPAIQTYRGAQQSLRISPVLLQSLKALGHSENATLFMTLLAAFQVLLYRYTGREDIVVGSPFSGRTHVELEDLIGFFVNTLPMRGDLSGNPKFRQLLNRIRKMVLDAYVHQDVPFEKLVEELNPVRDQSRTPIFQVLFNLENIPGKTVEKKSFGISEFLFDSGIAPFDLTLEIVEKEKGLYCLFIYNTDLFNNSTIERMASHFLNLLESIVANPEREIGELTLLTEEERHRLLVEWNDTKVDYPEDMCVHQLFEAQVEKSPNSVAVVFPSTSSGQDSEKQLTYRELNAKSNQLAHYLKTLGVGPEVLVGICVERSMEMVIGLLGILKAGGAYVPLDPDYPLSRLQFMLEDSGVEVLLSQNHLLERLPALEAKVVCLDSEWEQIEAGPEDNPIRQCGPENLAYVLFTSGSTGKPKGVMIEHKSATTLIQWAKDTFRKEHLACVLASTSINFDLSIFELFVPLCQGGQIFLVENALSLPALARKAEITLINTVPSAISELLCIQGIPNSVKVVNLAGEPLKNHLVQTLYQQDTIESVYNLYGPSEDTTYSTFTNIPKGGDREVNIGRPISNTQIYILDTNYNPTPSGIPGELCIAGAGLARGYLNRPELTAEKFIKIELFDQKLRLYKTGDLARYLPDGNIEFLGRIDNQVKIRGHRVELGEIEAVLGQHSDVQETVVIADEDEVSGKRLTAYVVTDRKMNTSITELHKFLQQKLPDYMIPAAFVFLDALPLLPNGKVDRKSLPAPDNTRPVLEKEFTAPRTPTEEILADIWAEVLGLEWVGVHNNFFELGGHSLIATRVISRIRDLLRVELPLKIMFDSPTVVNLALKIEQTCRTEKGLQIPPMLPVPRDGILPLSFAQQRLWFLDKLEPDNAAYNIPLAFSLLGPLNIEVLEQCMGEIIQRHESLRTVFETKEGKPFQVIVLNKRFKLHVIDLKDVSDTERKERIDRLATEEGLRPFDLSKDLMLRGTLLHLGKQEHILLLVMHHIASDGWSLGVLYRELSMLYEAFSSGKHSPLPELPIQYADFAVWQRHWLQGEELEKQLSYWKKQLAGLPPALDLPTDNPRPLTQTYRVAHQSMVVSGAITKKLRSLSCREGVTLFMTLLAAFKTLLYRYSCQEDIIVGSPIANRNIKELEPLIGFFVNTLVLRTSLSGNPRFNKLLKRVRELCLDAYTHQDIPFEKLVEELQPERDLSRTPIFQVWFNMINLENNRFELPGLTVENCPILEIPSKFDLSMYVREQNKKIHFKLGYNPDIFEQDRIIEMLTQLTHLLTQIVEKPDERIDNFSLVTPVSLGKLPNPTSALDSTWKGSVQALFTLQAKRVPKNLAILCKQEVWTYKRLDTCSNQLANYLIARGIKPQNIIAIYGFRSPSLVWAILGVLKAGASFVILDPSYPTLHLIAQLRIAKPLGWVQLEAAGVIPDTLEIFVKSLSCCCRIGLPQSSTTNNCGPLKGFSPDNPEININSDHLAYLIFTSGSTGKPKGILGGHGPLSHFLQWYIKKFNLKETDRFAMLSSISHDPALRDIFTPLSMGATLCIPNTEDIVSGRLSEWMEKEEISVTHLVPTMGQVLTEKSQGPICKSLRYVFFGGDKLTKYDVYRMRKLSPSVTCVNLYGATETPQAIGFFEIHNKEDMFNDDKPASLKQNIPIGKGTKDSQLLILNNSQQLCGIGETGEICVRSPHLTKGYIDDDILTKKQFVINPFTKGPFDGLYKTGDLGRYLPDGNIEFIGRIDNQVKIRGHRVELGEIEVVLGQHLGVRESVVVASEDGQGDKRLVAYVVPDKGAEPANNVLRKFLQQKLPDYMIPASFMFLESLPLLPNGKLDRKSLPAPDQTRPELECGFVPPRSPIEELLAGIWAEVLKLKQVGVYDNFFELGGHSLLSVQMFAKIQKKTGKFFPLSILFQAPTIAGLAAHIKENVSVPKNKEISIEQTYETMESGPSLIALQPKGKKTPLYFMHTIGGQLGRYYHLTKNLGPNQPVYGFQIQISGGGPRYIRIEDMAAHYIRELLSFQNEGPYLLCGHCFGGIIALEMAQQLRNKGHEVSFLGLFEVFGPDYNKPKTPSLITSKAYHLLHRIQFQLDPLFMLKPEESLALYWKKIKGILTGGINDKIIEEQNPMLEYYQNNEKVNRLASNAYSSQYYQGKMDLFMARDQFPGWNKDSKLGWGNITGGGLEIHKVPGYHNFILEEPRVRVLAERIKDCIKKV